MASESPWATSSEVENHYNLTQTVHLEFHFISTMLPVKKCTGGSLFCFGWEIWQVVGTVSKSFHRDSLFCRRWHCITNRERVYFCLNMLCMEVKRKSTLPHLVQYIRGTILNLNCHANLNLQGCVEFVPGHVEIVQTLPLATFVLGIRKLHIQSIYTH
jgi:hypothetical protein